jgi:alpha-mannosidase
MTAKLDKCEIHIIPGTHWDREWRYDFEETRQRLISLMENTLRLLENNPQIPAFVLDGQFLPIKDYLDVRPQNRDRIEKMVAAGRLLIGPWYSLPDFSVTLGESTIRNLLFGITNSRKFGNVMMDGMTNSSWGQISQMPQILSGFGINTYASYHGVPGHAYPIEFKWQSPDGTEILFIRSPRTTRAGFFLATRRALPPEPYEAEYVKAGSRLLKDAYRMTDEPTSDQTPLYGNDTNLSVNYDVLYSEVSKYVEIIRKETTTPHILIGDLCDAQQMCPDILQMVEELKKRHNGDDIHLSSIPEYFAKVKQSVNSVPVFKGEMRFPHKESFAFRLCNILSTRMYLKLANRTAENILSRWCEPFAALEWLANNQYPQAEIDQAWEYMLINQSHDAIGGCSVDHVHDDMLWRYKQVANRSRAILHRSLGFIAKQFGSGKVEANRCRMVVFNPLPFERSEIAEAYVDVPLDAYKENISITDTNGNPVQCQIMETSISKSVSLELQLIGCPAVFIRRLKIEFEADEIPKMGMRQFNLNFDGKLQNSPSLAAGSNWMENEFLKVNIAQNGTLELYDKTSGQTFSDLHYFEDDGMDRAARNSWYLIQPANNQIYSSKNGSAACMLDYVSPLQARLVVTYKMQIPKSLDLENVKIGRMEHFITYSYQNRSSEMVEMQIESAFTLRKGAKRVDVETRFVNNACDHRLRIMLPTDIETNYSFADAPFDVVQRPIEKLKKEEWSELRDLGDVQTQPMISFVDLSSNTRSFAFLSDGLPEYDIIDDKRRTVAITLVKSILHGRIDPETKIPPINGSQCLGEHQFRYSLYPHKGDWQQANVWKQAQFHNLPMKTVQYMDTVESTKADNVSLINFENEGLEISAIKRSQDGSALIARLYNPTDKQIKTAITVSAGRFKYATLANMLEEPLPNGKMSLKFGNTVMLDAAAKKIITIRLEKE